MAGPTKKPIGAVSATKNDNGILIHAPKNKNILYGIIINLVIKPYFIKVSEGNLFLQIGSRINNKTKLLILIQ